VERSLRTSPDPAFGGDLREITSRLRVRAGELAGTEKHRMNEVVRRIYAFEGAAEALPVERVGTDRLDSRPSLLDLGGGSPDHRPDTVSPEKKLGHEPAAYVPRSAGHKDGADIVPRRGRQIRAESGVALGVAQSCNRFTLFLIHVSIISL
jgi:hypothetical protein